MTGRENSINPNQFKQSTQLTDRSDISKSFKNIHNLPQNTNYALKKQINLLAIKGDQFQNEVDVVSGPFDRAINASMLTSENMSLHFQKSKVIPNTYNVNDTANFNNEDDSMQDMVAEIKPEFDAPEHKQSLPRVKEMRTSFPVPNNSSQLNPHQPSMITNFLMDSQDDSALNVKGL